MEAVSVAQIHASIHHQFGRIPARRESALVRAEDGWVSPGLEIGVREDIWARVCDLMGVPELADDPAFSTREARREHQQDVLAIVGEWAAKKTKGEIYHTLQGMRTIAGYVATAEDLFKSAQLQSRQYFQPVNDPRAGETMYPGAPFSIGDDPWHQPAAPRLGQHTEEVLCGQLGYSAEDLERLRGQGVV
jgi:formyl-CoA transferase